QVIHARPVCIEQKAALGHSSDQDLVARLQVVKLRSQLTSGHQLDEELDFVLVRRRHDGIGAFASLVRTLHAERGVLAGPELELAARIYPDAPKIGRKINSPGDPAAVKLVVGAHLMAAAPLSLA